eukprot:scaffold293702_cov28-Tisochrysis_lutea.AAC.2
MFEFDFWWLGLGECLDFGCLVNRACFDRLCYCHVEFGVLCSSQLYVLSRQLSLYLVAMAMERSGVTRDSPLPSHPGPQPRAAPI